MIKFQFLACSCLIMTSLAAFSQATTAKKPKESEEKLGYLYILPVGDTPRIFRDSKATDGVRLQIDPPSGESVPFSMYVNAGAIPKSIRKLLKSTEEKYPIALSRNIASKPILFNKTEDGFRLVNEPGPSGGSPISWNIKLPPSAEALAVVTPKNYKSRPWSSTLIKTIDCSEKKIPAGAVLTLNMSPYTVLLQSGKAKVALKPGQSYLVKKSKQKKIPLILQIKQGKHTAHIHRNWVPASSESRQIFVVYFTPRSKDPIKANLCKTTLPLKPSMLWLKKQVAPPKKKSSATP